MSSASIPVPRSKSSESRSGQTRHTLFWPMFIFLLGAGSLAYYQVQDLSDQLEQLTRTADALDVRVKRAQYEKNKFFRISRDLLQLADKNEAADAIVVHFKLRKLAQARPELMNANAPTDLDLAAQAIATNAAPVKPTAPATNAAPVKSTP